MKWWWVQTILWDIWDNFRVIWKYLRFLLPTKITCTANSTMFIFITEGNDKFQLMVCKAKDVNFFPVQICGSFEFNPWTLPFRIPFYGEKWHQMLGWPLWVLFSFQNLPLSFFICLSGSLILQTDAFNNSFTFSQARKFSLNYLLYLYCKRKLFWNFCFGGM